VGWSINSRGRRSCACWRKPIQAIAINTDLDARYAALRAAATTQAAPDAAERKRHLRSLARALRKHRRPLERAVRADFGNRSVHETRLLELFLAHEAANVAARNVADWMAPQKRAVAKWYAPAHARIVWQPLGVVGIIAPWNYPILLAAGPLVGALSAGNRVLIKTSEHAPQTGEAFAAMIASIFASDHVSVIGGEADVAQAFSALPLDHLLFTGSTTNGKSVMRAAADNLTPVTLELGGKSPAIVGPDADLDVAAARIMTGKCSNAGQTCVAPDYVLVPEGSEDAFLAAAQAAVARRYPRLAGNPDYTTIVSDRHVRRLAGYLADARTQGARVVPLHPRETEIDPTTRMIPPLAVLAVSDDMQIMQDEIFGPLLPIRTYRTLDDAIAYVNARPRPLALYYFGERKPESERVIAQTISGGVTLNDTMLHVAQDDLPFGGVGPSGTGAYHGRDGFERFSHKKPIFAQARRNLLGLFEPPYGSRFDALFRLLMR